MNQPQSDTNETPSAPSSPPPVGAGGPVPPIPQPYIPPVYMTPPPVSAPPLVQAPASSKPTPKVVTLGNLSVFSMAASLVFFGAFTFFGGFLLGMWFELPPTVRYVGPNEGIVIPREVVPQQAPPMPQPAGPEKQSTTALETQEALGDTAKSVFGTVVGARAPLFLSPLASAAQEALGRGVEKTVHAASGGPTYSHPSQAMPVQQPHYTQQDASHYYAPPPSQGEVGGYTVQLGVYAAPENAERLRTQLQGLNYEAAVVEGHSPEGETLYYVQSGHYRDYGTALEAVSQLASQHIPGAIVVKLPQASK